MLTCNLHGNRINRDTLVREGCGYTGKHAPDFMQAKDKWFRGIDLLTGPDGNVFVADWSDSGECHDNDGIHRTSGRIYKIVYEPSQKDASLYTNNWHSRTELQKQFEAGKGPKPRTLYSLADANSNDGLVRLNLASDMQKLPLEARWPIATALAQRAEDANDRQQPLMIWYGIEPAVAADPLKGVELIATAKHPTVRRLVARRIAEDIEKQPAAVDALVDLMTKEAAVRGDILEGMAAGLDGFSTAKKPANWDAFVGRIGLRPVNGLRSPDLQSPSTSSSGDLDPTTDQTSMIQNLSLIFGTGRTHRHRQKH
jgi:hypothetical protein